MLACCDIGNTNIKVGAFNNDSLLKFSSFNSLKYVTEYLKNLKPHEVAISSVVPQSTSLLLEFLEDVLGIQAFVVDINKKFRLSIDYDTPDTLGIDRICTSEGAFELYSYKNNLLENEILLAIDLGTACTINVIEHPGAFKGGIIAAGPGLLFKAMKLYTAQLPEASMSDYSGITGRSTKECIASGVRNSISGLLEKIFNELSENKKVAGVYITGGNAPLFIDDLNFSFNYIPELLIHGIKSVYYYNTRS